MTDQGVPTRHTLCRGAARARLGWGWQGLSDADLTTLRSAYADCDEGAKALLVSDEGGTLRWMRFTADTTLRHGVYIPRGQADSTPRGLG